MAQPGTIRIWWDVDAEAYRMITPFNAAFKALFEQVLPASARSFDYDSKIWTFQEQYLTKVSELVKKLWTVEPVVVSKEQAQKASTAGVGNATTNPLDKVIVDFVRMIPYEAMQQAYRRAAMLMHPDRNPQASMDEMSKMNASWQRLEKELYKK